MLISNTEITRKLKSIWPNLSFIWLTDELFDMQSAKDLADLVKENSVKNEAYMTRQQACEEFSLFLVADIRRYRYKTDPNGYNRPIGIVFGNMHNEVAENHYWNIALTTDGIYGVEPQTDEIWKMTEATDNPLLIKI